MGARLGCKNTHIMSWRMLVLFSLFCFSDQNTRDKTHIMIVQPYENLRANPWNFAMPGVWGGELVCLRQWRRRCRWWAGHHPQRGPVAATRSSLDTDSALHCTCTQIPEHRSSIPNMPAQHQCWNNPAPGSWAKWACWPISRFRLAGPSPLGIRTFFYNDTFLLASDGTWCDVYGGLNLVR